MSDLNELAESLTARQRVAFLPDNLRDLLGQGTRIWPGPDAKAMTKLGLVERRSWQSNHSLRRQHVYYVLSPLGEELATHLNVRALSTSMRGEGG